MDEKETLAYRCICEPWCRCEKKVVCIDLLPRISGGSISVFALRETCSSKWCFVPHYLNRPLYRDRPSDGGGAGTRGRKKSREDSREGATITTRLFLSFWTSRYSFSEKLLFLLENADLYLAFSCQNARSI